MAGSNLPSALLKLLLSQGLRPRSYTQIDASGEMTILDSESKYIITELWSRQMENGFMTGPHVDNLYDPQRLFNLRHTKRPTGFEPMETRRAD